MAEKKYYSKTEAAEMLGVCTRTVERYLNDRKLKGAFVGRAWRISGDDIRDFFEAAKASTQQNLDDGKTGQGRTRKTNRIGTVSAAVKETKP